MPRYLPHVVYMGGVGKGGGLNHFLLFYYTDWLHMPILWGSILSEASDTFGDHLSKLGKLETWKSDVGGTRGFREAGMPPCCPGQEISSVGIAFLQRQ